MGLSKPENEPELVREWIGESMSIGREIPTWIKSSDNDTHYRFVHAKRP